MQKMRDMDKVKLCCPTGTRTKDPMSMANETGWEHIGLRMEPVLWESTYRTKSTAREFSITQMGPSMKPPETNEKQQIRVTEDIKEISIGSWANDQRHGEGTYFYPNGDMYNGEWLSHQRFYNSHTTAMANNLSADIFEFIQEEIEASGEAHMVKGRMCKLHTDRARVQGRSQMAEVLRHGHGTYVYALTRSKYEGNWVHGKQVGGGELIHLNHRYQGNFLHNNPTGKGKYIFDFGCEQHGEYLQMEQLDKTKEELEEEVSVSMPLLKWKAEKISGLTLYLPTFESEVTKEAEEQATDEAKAAVTDVSDSEVPVTDTAGKEVPATDGPETEAPASEAAVTVTPAIGTDRTEEPPADAPEQEGPRADPSEVDTPGEKADVPEDDTPALEEGTEATAEAEPEGD
ncbi:uncharacterized protein rsph1 isoform X2 [Narcine bancroftii]|uniref:uncharacterized protein rsph1 isoform X2 n=1 Tax=Narcine bancroftii TaxID=1343680 RepID=UPI00383168D7